MYIFHSLPDHIRDAYLEMTTEVDGVHGLTALHCAAMRNFHRCCALLALFMRSSALKQTSEGLTARALAEAHGASPLTAEVLLMAEREQGGKGQYRRRDPHEPIVLSNGERVFLAEAGEWLRSHNFVVTSHPGCR